MCRIYLERTVKLQLFRIYFVLLPSYSVNYWEPEARDSYCCSRDPRIALYVQTRRNLRRGSVQGRHVLWARQGASSPRVWPRILNLNINLRPYPSHFSSPRDAPGLWRRVSSLWKALSCWSSSCISSFIIRGGQYHFIELSGTFRCDVIVMVEMVVYCIVALHQGTRVARDGWDVPQCTGQPKQSRSF